MLFSYLFSSFVFIDKYPEVENRKNQQTGVQVSEVFKSIQGEN